MGVRQPENGGVVFRLPNSNLDFKDLEKKYSQTSGMEDKIAGARIVERIQSLAKSIVLSGKDRRLKD